MNCKKLNRRSFLKKSSTAAGLLAMGSVAGIFGEKTKPNIVLLTADDMNVDSVGCFGSYVKDATPNLDKLASQGMRFEHAHMQTTVCMPSRHAIMCGKYPHVSGSKGFQDVNEDVKILPSMLRDAGYKTACFGKVGHSSPKNSPWDMSAGKTGLGYGRSPELYYKLSKKFIENSMKEEKPFFLVVNSHDPHRPYHTDEPKKGTRRYKPCMEEIEKPSRVYKPDQVDVPGFLPDTPEMRKDMAKYYSSVRRCDDTMGRIMDLLKEKDLEENTLVMFVSDHGLPAPYGKANVYFYSTKTPWIVRWPGRIKTNAVDREHFISAIDYMPTVLEAVGLEPPKDLNGRSIKPLLKGKKQKGRDYVFTQFTMPANWYREPMRCIQSKDFAYIFNPWAGIGKPYRSNNVGSAAGRAFQKAAENDPEIKKRWDFYINRALEEFYDLRKDPDCVKNLIDDPAYKKQLDNIRNRLEKWMIETDDPVLPAYKNRYSEDYLKKFMKEQYKKAEQEFLEEKGRPMKRDWSL